MSIGHQLLDVPMGDMIRQMAFAIADGQYQLDENSISVAEMMGGITAVHDDQGGVTFDDSRVFFGYEYMTIAEAMAYAVMDDAVTGGTNTAGVVDMVDAVKQIAELTHGVTITLDPAKKVTAVQSDSVNTPMTKTERESFLTDPKKEIRVPTRMSMLELGFTPNFYQFVDTIIEVKIAIKMTYEQSSSETTSTNTRTAGRKGRLRFRRGRLSGGTKTTVKTTQVDATYSSKYSYSAEGASILRTKIVPVPPPSILEDRIRSYMDAEERRRLNAVE